MGKRLISIFVGLACIFPLYLSAQHTSSGTLLEEGKILFEKGNYAAASQTLREYLRIGGKNIHTQETDYMLARAAYELKATNRIDLLQDYLDKFPDSSYTNQVYALLASAYFYEHKYDRAIALFNSCRIEKLGKTDRDAATLCLATSLLEVGKLKDAAIWFRVLKESGGAYRADADYHLAYIDYLQKRYDNALSVFLSLQDDKKYAETVPYYIGEIYLLKKNYDKAQIVAQNYLSAWPAGKNPLMLRILGEAEYGMKQYSAAVKALSDYIRSAPEPERSVRFQLGMSYFYTRVYSKAAETLDEVTGIKDELSQNAYLHIGLAYLQLKDKTKARMAFEQAASTNFSLQVKELALYNYALCLHETAYSPFDESVKVFERFLNEFPGSPYAEKVSDYLIDVYMDTRSYQAALSSIAKITHPGPRILEAKQKILFRLGTQAFANTLFKEAVGYFDQSLALGQYNTETRAEAYYWRGEAYFRMGQYDSASASFRQYMEFARDKNSEMYALACYNLGYTAFKKKDYSGALKWFDKYIGLAKKENIKLLADAYNRIGDCYFHVRGFAKARENYAAAQSTDHSLGDYSFYQEAFVRGLQKEYSGKVELLNKLVAQYPQSQYLDEAYYEIGRAYVQMEDNNHAIGAFRKLLDDFPESASARKGANEIGLLYYQNDDYQHAVEAYKKVILSYPGSEEARLAQRDLKSIYIDQNKVDEYAGFVSGIPGGASFDPNERDSLTYIAAEKIYMRGDVNGAQSSFEKYLQTFPQGAFGLDAHYYLGMTNYNRKNDAQALAHLEKILEFPGNKFSEDAMTVCAEIYFNHKEFSKALDVYKRLKEKASSSEKRQMAKTGIMRSAYQAGNTAETILAATDLLADTKLTPEQENEARYMRAKAYLSQNKAGVAKADLNVLAKDTRNLYGAEAKYLLAQLYVDEHNLAAAEKEIFDYIEQSTPHAYWLARSFILLSDIYMETGKKLDAKQYLLSLKENYNGKDEIAGMIESRLKKLSK